MRNVSVLIALATGAHRALLEALLGGFRAIPVGGVIAPANSLKMICDLSSSVLLVGVRLALPMLAVLFIVQVTLAFVSRAAPQLQVFSVGFAIATAVGLTTLVLIFPDITRGFVVEYSQVTAHIERLYSDVGSTVSSENEFGEKTEPATPEKRQRARDEGQMARSRDGGAVAATGAVIVLILASGTLCLAC